MNKRVRLGIYTVVFFALYPFWIVSIAQDYQQAAQQAKQYEQEKGSAAVYDEPLYVNGKDSDYHRSGSDYFLELREAGGKLRRIGIPSYDFWTSVAQGETVTGEIWRDKVRFVTDHGQTEQTATNPHYQMQELGHSLWQWGAFGLVVAALLLYSNWYSYINRYSLLETERNDATL